MTTYLNIVYFNFLRFLTYPLEIGAALLRWLCDIGFIVLFWVVVARSSNGVFDLKQLVLYFVVANAVNVLVGVSRLSFAKAINHMIKRGEVSNYLIKPIGIVPHLYAMYLGRDGLNLIIAAITLLVGLILTSINHWLNAVLFIALMGIAVLISFSINLVVGLISFYTPEAMGIRFSIDSFISILSGALVPLTFFPEGFRAILSLTFLPSMVYIPTAMITGRLAYDQAIRAMEIGGIWAVLLLIISLSIWNKAIRNYDAVGM